MQIHLSLLIATCPLALALRYDRPVTPYAKQRLRGNSTGSALAADHLELLQQEELHYSDQEPLSLLYNFTPFDEDQKLKVVFGVFTSPKAKYAEQMEAVADTWAKDVYPQKLLVVGVDGTKPNISYKLSPMCQDGHINNPGISCKEATLLSTGFRMGADWVVVAGSDNYVFPRNFEERLLQEDKHKPQILGIHGCGDGKYCEDGKSGLCGGGGYAISHAALKAMIGEAPGAGKKFVKDAMETASGVGGGWSDQVTSCMARRANVTEVQLDGLYGWKLCDPGQMDCGFATDAYRSKIMSKSPKPLTFHYITPTDMHTIHEMVKDTESGLSTLQQKQKESEEAALCSDGHSWCKFWADSGECRTNPNYMHFNCQRSCGTCESFKAQSALSFLQVSEDDFAAQRKAYIEQVNKEMTSSLNVSAM
jgi:hypothetical protein